LLTPSLTYAVQLSINEQESWHNRIGVGCVCFPLELLAM